MDDVLGAVDPVLDAGVRRRVGWAHDATAHIDVMADAVDLYRRAADRAEQDMPAPLGPAIAGVLTMAAYRRRLGGIRGSLGADRTMMALADAVLNDTPPATVTVITGRGDTVAAHAIYPQADPDAD